MKERGNMCLMFVAVQTREVPAVGGLAPDHRHISSTQASFIQAFQANTFVSSSMHGKSATAGLC